MSAPAPILALVARFEQQLDAYKSGQFNETQLRRDFLDPLFKALGWDMDNTAGYAEAYRDVIHEDAIRIGSAVKAPDYCFRIGGTRKFFLEAKKPSVFIKEEIPPAYQLRRYAWSAKLPLSVLSDFEEFAVYDCRVKPAKDDPAATARVFYCTFRDFAEKWDWIASIFSRDAILKGSFDKYAEANKAKRGTAEVDADFLASMENWRHDLARNLALRNPRLSQRELNFAVQRILDRIVFLRICEDRGLEDYGRLLALTNGARIYPRLGQLFEQADTRYNSGLFHFQPERGRHEPPDELTLGLDVDDRLLRDLLKGLYYPDSPYEFSVLSADILGQVYEQFLGKVIRLTEGHQAKIEEKPEVRKAGGVYYTPTYIVDYIVRQTVGKLVEDISGHPVSTRALPPHPDPLRQGEVTAAMSSSKSRASDSNPALVTILSLPGGEGRGEGERGTLSPQAAAAILNRVGKLRILDPACGSGSFLICAYQFLLDWHLQFCLANDPAKWAKGKKPALVQTTRGWKLTIAERKRILLAHIYGVDIDAQAVEVTKLSLLLKVLEGENQQTIEPLFRIFHERALPDLGDNIKCGNSLIGPDFYQQPELPLLSDDEKYRINVFDWQAEFPNIFRRATSTGELHEPAAASPLDYGMPGVPLHGRYSYKKKKLAKTAPPAAPLEPEWEGGFDAVIGNPPYGAAFTPAEKSYFLTNWATASGRFESYWYFLEKGTKLLNRHGQLGFIVPDTWFTLQAAVGLRRLLLETMWIRELTVLHENVFRGVKVDVCTIVMAKSNADIPTSVRIASKGHTLADFKEGRFVREFKIKQTTWCQAEESRITVHLPEAASRILTKMARVSRPLGECAVATTGPKPYQVGKGNPPQTKKTLELKPFTSTYKTNNTFRMMLRGDDIARYSYPDAKTDEWLSYGEWLAEVRDPKVFEQPRLLVQSIRNPRLERRIVATHTTGSSVNNNSITNVVMRGGDCSILYVLGILNSELVNWLFAKSYSIVNIDPRYLKIVPLRTINFSNAADKAAHDRMVSLVEQMLALHRQLASARTPHEQTALERQIAATDAQIDRLVYQLYGLTEEEIEIVKGSAPT